MVGKKEHACQIEWHMQVLIDCIENTSNEKSSLDLQDDGFLVSIDKVLMTLVVILLTLDL